MAYTINWYHQDVVILAELSGDLEIEEFPIMDEILLNHIEASSLPLVHIVINLKAVKKFPNSVAQIHKALSHLNHPRMGWSILVTDNRFIRFVGYTVTQISKARFRAFNEEAEAMRFLETVDSKLKSAMQSQVRD
jgi:hypothetical protein